jgi:hypothetical protein
MRGIIMQSIASQLKSIKIANNDKVSVRLTDDTGESVMKKLKTGEAETVKHNNIEVNKLGKLKIV